MADDLTSPSSPKGAVIAELMDPLCAPFRLQGTNGEVVVLIHGFTGNPAHFRPMAEFLNERGYSVSIPLLPGHGTSMQDLATTGWRDWQTAVEQTVSAVASHRRVHLVGLSMGGLLAILVAARMATTTITTINSPVILIDKRFYISPLLTGIRPTVLWPESENPVLDEAVAPYWINYPGFHSKNAADLLFLSAKAAVVAGRIRRPSLVIQTKADLMVDPRSGPILARRLGPNCRLVTLEHAMHNSLLSPERDVIHQAVLELIS